MPGLDKSGPTGKGAQSGRGMGKCNPKSESTKTEVFRRGRGFGRFSKGFRFGNSIDND